MRARTRNLFPPSGAAYELFDCAVFLVALAAIGYVIYTPPNRNAEALSAATTFASDQTWGLVLMAAGLAGVLCSYRQPWIKVGILIVQIAAAFWSGVFLLGVIFYDAPPRVFLSALIYGWIASRLYRVRKELA